METQNSGLTIQPVRPRDLSQENFERLNEVSQDIWATEAGLWEFVQCLHCHKMHSKEDIFGSLPKEIFQKTVSDIMQGLHMKKVPCQSCWGETRMIYGPENVDRIKERVLDSVASFLILCTDAQDQIVGFEEGYIDTPPKIFDRDLAYHYRRIGLPEVSRRVDEALGYTPEHLLILSSIGLLEPHRNFANLFELLNQFARTVPDIYLDMPGITELDKGNVIYRMSSSLNTGISLGINDSPMLRHQITDIGEKYHSDLVVYRDPVHTYREHFTNGMKHFLRLSRQSKAKEIPRILTHS